MIYYNMFYGSQIMIRSSSLEVTLNVSEWFPNTQAKLKRLLDIMNDYDDDGMMFNIINALIDDLRDPAMFKHRPNREKDTFKRMLHKNIDKLIEYGERFI